MVLTLWAVRLNTMASYIEHTVRSLRDSAAETQVELLLGVSGETESLERHVRELGGAVHEQIGHATLEVSLPENRIDELCELDDLESIELNEADVRPHADGVDTGNS